MTSKAFAVVRRRSGKGSSISIEKHQCPLAYNSRLTYIARVNRIWAPIFGNTWRNNFWYVPASWSTDYVYNAVFRPHFDQRITNRLYFRPIRDTERAQRVAHQNSARTTCYLLALLLVQPRASRSSDLASPPAATTIGVVTAVWPSVELINGIRKCDRNIKYSRGGLGFKFWNSRGLWRPIFCQFHLRSRASIEIFVLDIHNIFLLGEQLSLRWIQMISYL